MKKSKIFMFIPLMVLMFSSLICVSSNNSEKCNYNNSVTLICKNNTLINEEKVYTFENSVATYTFKLDTELKTVNVSFVNKLTKATGNLDGSFTLEDNVLTIIVNEEELFRFEVLEDGTLKLKADSFTDKINNIVQTFIVPLTAGLSVTTIISLIVSITFAILNRKNNIKSKESVLSSSALILETIKSNNDLIKEVIETKKISEESVKTFVTQTDTLINEVAQLTEQTELLERLKQSQKAVVEALALISSNTKELVTSGTANKINEISDEIKEI